MRFRCRATLALSAFALLPACGRIPPSQACAGPLDGSYRILVVGESWAAGGKELPELPQAVSARLHMPVRACEIGYPGATTGEIRRFLARDYSSSDIRKMLGGNANQTILLVGVNDVVNHVGSERYVLQVRELVSDTLKFSLKTSVVELPIVNVRPETSFMSKSKRALYEWLNDRGDNNAIATYRRTLASDAPGVKLIAFDKFSPGYDRDKADFQPDGIHFTAAAFHKYGAYIGQELPIQ